MNRPAGADDPTLIEVTADDGARSSISIYPAADADAPLALLWPAMGVSARYYQPLAAALAAGGLNVAVAELRGIGSSSVRADRHTDFGYRDLIERDWPAAVSAIRTHFPSSPLWLFGHSLGGQISALYAARHPQELSGLVLVASGNVYYRGWHGARRWGLLAFTQFAAALSRVLGYFPGKRIGFGGTEARTLMRDWAQVARSGRYRPRGSDFDYEAALAQLRLPVLGISFDHDPFAPHPAMQFLLGKLSAADVTHQQLGDADTGLRLDHFNWVKQPAPVVERIARWLKLPQVQS